MEVHYKSSKYNMQLRNKVGQFTTHSWTIRNIQLLIIIGLVTAIGAEWVRQAGMLSFAVNETVYAKEETPVEAKCLPDNIHCLVNEWAHLKAVELYEENREADLEHYRLQAIGEQGRDVLIAIMDNSDFVDYQEMAERYGY